VGGATGKMKTPAVGGEGSGLVSMKEPSVHARGLTREYHVGQVVVRALQEVNLDIPQGRFVILLGPSGSGKTTLLNLIGGLDVATSGELTVLGKRLDQLTEAGLTEYRRGTVGYIFQLFNLVPTLTAQENVALVGDLVGTGHRALDLLKSVGLGERANQFPSQLSGGEQQRVGIARALVKEPRLLLADEPTGSLDSETGSHVLQLMWSETRRRGVTVLMVTHNEDYAAFGDVIIRLQSGRVVQVQEQATPRQPSELSI